MAVSALKPQAFGASYAAQAAVLPGGARLAALRDAARAELARGLPGPKHEAWRFTPLTALGRIGFIPAAAAADVDVTAVPVTVPRLADAVRLVLVNGVFRAELSDAPGDIDVRPLDAALGDIDALLGRAAPAGLPLVALNTAFLNGGIAITAAAPVRRPIHLVSIGASGAEPVAFHPRVVLSTAPGADVTLVETHVGLPGQPFFANPVVEILVAEDARVRRYVDVTEDGDAYHIGTAGVTVAARGRYEAFHLGLGGPRSHGTVRQETHVRIDGEGADVALGGVYALGGDAHHDFTTVIAHRSGGSRSNQLFKGVLDGKAHGVYQGRVQVEVDAQKTDARQLHRALFLTAGPAVDVKPELEIAADDVQCAHGATTGSLDADALFYLAARGIDPETARALLVEGFVTEALDQVSAAAVRDLLAARLGLWLKRRGGGA